MKKYETYAPHDFLTDDWFLAWVKYDQPDAREFWQAFQQRYPDRRADLLLAKDMAEALYRRPKSLPDEQVQREVTHILRLARSAKPEKPPFGLPPRVFRTTVLAMTLIGMVLSSWSLWRWYRSGGQPSISVAASTDKSMTDGWVNQLNGTSQPVTITLPDRSQMVLQPSSQARYKARFNQHQREVWLTGDATFAVVRDVRRPFLVRTGPLITRVLGTRFRVHAPGNNARITVSVQHGKVSVYSQRDLTSLRQHPNRQMPGVVLTANQQVIYDAQRTSYQRELVAQPTLLDPNRVTTEQFNFQDTPVATVFDRLQKSYGITIQYDAVLFRHCTLTASLAGVSLHDQLRLICASIGATYQIVDTQIVISGLGCQ